ncbi:MAG: hypothetical protein RL264_2183 [Bacteroidota bacterium]|jgi:uncharacterized protein YdhG (YjbR/CyaY superfamily)
MENKQPSSPYGSVKFATIDEYHAQQPALIQEKLNELRSMIKAVVPDAIETISYNMPAFKLKKVLVYYAAYNNHIGFYPTSQPIVVFEKELQPYKTSKGAIQFPIHQDLPKELIQAIVKFCLENL